MTINEIQECFRKQEILFSDVFRLQKGYDIYSVRTKFIYRVGFSDEVFATQIMRALKKAGYIAKIVAVHEILQDWSKDSYYEVLFKVVHAPSKKDSKQMTNVMS